MNRPSNSRVAAVLLLTGMLLASGCSSENQPSPDPSTVTSTTPRTANPANGIPEDPSAVLHGSDLSKAFGEICILGGSELAGAQSAVSTYECATFNLTVTEAKGDEVVDYWLALKSDKTYKPAPSIGKNILISGDSVAARKRGEDATFVQVSLSGGSKAATPDRSGFEILGKLLAKKFG